MFLNYKCLCWGSGITYLAGTCATGTLTFTNVVGQWSDNEALTIMDKLSFDTVAACGFTIGDTLFEACPGTAQITVRALEYNFVDINDCMCDVAGAGRAYGCITVASFTDGDLLRLVSSTGTTVATVDG